MTDLPVIMTDEGPQVTPPATLRAALVAGVAATNPGYTSNLPLSMVEDIASTDVGAMIVMDQARVDTINSVTPRGANAFLLKQLGAIYGVQQGGASVTSVFVQFEGTPGFVIAKGFVVSDGTYQYTVQDGGIIGSGGSSPLLFCLANVSGSWAVAAGTVIGLVTSFPTSITLTVNNPQPGTPASEPESESSFRAGVLEAGLASAQGMPTLLRTLLRAVPGVQPRLIAPRQVTGGGWEILVGGGDPYQVAYAIFTALFDISTLAPSVISVTGVTKVANGVYTTDLNHGLVTGQVATVAGSNPSSYNHSAACVVIDEKTFTFGLNTSGFANYVSGGVVTPNNRNIVTSIDDFPDTYIITFVNPPQQTVTATITWNTSSTNFVSEAGVAQLAAPAIAAYVNAVIVGQPMNLFEMQTVFQEAVASILTPALLTRMVFAVAINGIGTSPTAGTGIIAGDPESYFFTSTDQITVVKG